MKFLFLTLLFFTLSITFIFSAKQEVVRSPISSKVLPRQNSNIHPSKSFSRLTNGNRDDLILWDEDFESNAEGWTTGSGWQLTTDEYNSETHSMNSPNDVSTLNGTFNLLTPGLVLPEIGTEETMHFGFWLYVDMPDYSQTDDPITEDVDESESLADYYSISIQEISAEPAWHLSDFNTDNGNNFWCSDEDVGGYLDNWIQYLDTPTISVGAGGGITARLYYEIESDAGATVAGSCTDGWDVANIRISKDGGSTWSLLEDSSHPYHFDCGYGWIYNDDQYELGGSLNHLAKGWGGSSNDWVDFSADLSAYSGEDIIIRFAFGSDPEWSTVDDDLLTGFQVDEISVFDDSGSLFSNNGNDILTMSASGEIWINQFYDYGSAEDERPGASGWEEYAPGFPFNGNTFLNISEFAGKIIKLRIQSRYDDNHDGGQGGGLYIDDFMIYKLSTGAYFAPWGLEAEAGDSEVSLTWADMNSSGTADFKYENGEFDPEDTIITNEGNGWAGELFDIIGSATINSFSIYNNYQLDTTITVQVYGMFGSTIDTDPTYTMEALVNFGWNEIDVTEWNIENYFVIAHEISPSFGVALDITQSSGHSWIRLGGTWKSWNFDDELGYIGEFGIRANITYEGAGVTYNVYRDDELLVTGISINSYTDTEVENNISYEYAVSATYPDGEESGKSTSISVTPLAASIHELAHDDGTFESEFNAGSNNFSVVRFQSEGEGEIARFKWYQIVAEGAQGGAFYIMVFGDENGTPGTEIYSKLIASGINNGWNDKDLSDYNIVVNGDYWVGVKEFSTSRPFGLDTTTISGSSFMRIGDDGEWTAVEGNLGYRVYIDGNPLAISESNSPYKMTLGEAYPNPFNPSTTIQFELDRFGPVSLSIYNLNGRLVNKLINDTMHPGNYNSIWNGTNLRGNQVSSGIYLAVFESNGMLVQTRKLVILK